MNKWLKGNGHWCEACDGTGQGVPLDRIEYSGGGHYQFYQRCQFCGGDGRVAKQFGGGDD